MLKKQNDVFRVYYKKYYRPFDIQNEKLDDKNKLQELQNSKKTIDQLYPVPPMPEYKKKRNQIAIDQTARYQFYQILNETGYSIKQQASKSARGLYTSTGGKDLQLTFSGEKFSYRPSTGNTSNNSPTRSPTRYSCKD